MHVMKKTLSLFFILICFNSFAQSFQFNNAIKICLEKICNSEKTDELIFETTVLAYYRQRKKLPLSDSFSEDKIKNWISNSFCMIPQFDSKLNLGDTCFQTTKNLKIHITNSSEKFIKKINSKHCFNIYENIIPKKKICIVYPCQPVEINESTFLLVFAVNNAYKYFQKERFVGIKLSELTDETLYFFVIKTIKQGQELVVVKKINDFGFFCMDYSF